MRYWHMFKTPFLQKNVNNFETLRLYDKFFSDFSKKASELSSFISASFKSIVTVELAEQVAGQI